MAAYGGDALVKNFCSPRNILYAHNKLYLQLLEELCLLGTLKANPKSKKTIIIPDAKLTAQLIEMVKTKGEDEVAQLCRMLVLKGHVDDLSEIGSTATISGLLIPVESANKNEATVKDGGKISKMKIGVRNLGPEPVFSVYELSGALVPIGASANGVEAPAKKPKKGGAELGKEVNRVALFERALMETATFTDKKRDPALEILCSLVNFFEEEKSDNKAQAILSMISDDSLTSLFLVLRPAASMSPYLDDDDIARWSRASSTDVSFVLFCFKNPYDTIKASAQCFNEICERVKQIMNETVDMVYKPGYMRICNNAYTRLLNEISQRSDVLGVRAQNRTVEDLKFETEVRVSAAIHRENVRQFGIEERDLRSFYERYRDGTAVHLSDKTNMGASDTSASLYLSLFHTAIRCDGFFYLPCFDFTNSLNESVSTENSKMINLTKDLFDRSEHENFYDTLASYAQQRLKSV